MGSVQQHNPEGCAYALVPCIYSWGLLFTSESRVTQIVCDKRVLGPPTVGAVEEPLQAHLQSGAKAKKIPGPCRLGPGILD